MAVARLADLRSEKRRMVAVYHVMFRGTTRTDLTLLIWLLVGGSTHVNHLSKLPHQYEHSSECGAGAFVKAP